MGQPADQQAVNAELERALVEFAALVDGPALVTCAADGWDAVVRSVQTSNIR
jgi:hypothetical protein